MPDLFDPKRSGQFKTLGSLSLTKADYSPFDYMAAAVGRSCEASRRREPGSDWSSLASISQISIGNFSNLIASRW